MSDPQPLSGLQPFLAWAVGALGTGFTTLCVIIWYWFKRFVDDVDQIKKTSHEFIKDSDLSARYASVIKLLELEKRMESLVTRKEMVAQIAHLTEARERMHKENIDRLDESVTDIREMRKDVGQTHARIDDLFKILVARSKHD